MDAIDVLGGRDKLFDCTFCLLSELAANACLIEDTLSEVSNCICPEIRPRLRTPLPHNESDDHSTDGTQDKDWCVGFGDDGVRQA